MTPQVILKRNYFKSSDRVGYLNIDILHAVKRLNLKIFKFFRNRM